MLLKTEGLAAGRQASEFRLGEIIGQIRRKLSLATVKANVDCLMARLILLGGQSSEAGKRRRSQKQAEHWMRMEQEASWRAYVSGRSVIRKGRFLMD